MTKLIAEAKNNEMNTYEESTWLVDIVAETCLTIVKRSVDPKTSQFKQSQSKGKGRGS